jgi:thiol-disulfide isomerase/thioredoxin
MLIMRLFNHYSVVIIGALLLLAGLAIVKHRGGTLFGWLILFGVLAVYAGAWLLFRPVAHARGTATGQSLLLEVQSPYCLGCVALKPAVDRLETELQDKLVVRHVDIQSAEGRRLVKQYAIEFTPTFILFDAAGKEQWRSVGQLDTDRVRATL